MKKETNHFNTLANGTEFASWEKPLKFSKTYYVNNNTEKADDNGPGTIEHPFKTISKAAKILKPGERVVISGGVYRESIHPECGGTSPEKMISYEAAEGEKVVVKGSAVLEGWEPSKDWKLNWADFRHTPGCSVWEIELDGALFGGYNPFGMVNVLHDRLYLEYGKIDMTPFLNRRGMIFVDGIPLQQVTHYYQLGQGCGRFWIEHNGMKLHIRLPEDKNPNNHLIEATVKEQIFAPKKQFLGYIRIHGITFEHAGNGFPPPQRGAVSAYRGHHWVIEDSTINWATSVGIDLGNECWHRASTPKDFSNHIVRRNVINGCGVCGLAALEAENLLIEDNIFENIGWQLAHFAWESGGVKVHFSKNMMIRRNVFRDIIGCDALWLDCSNVNCRITSNVFLNMKESREAIFMEANREENLIDNNIIWGVEGRYNKADVVKNYGSAGWYNRGENDVENGYGIYIEGSDRLKIVNNLIGDCRNSGFYAQAVAFRIHDGIGGLAREHKLYNNIFYKCGKAAIKFATKNNYADGNVYIKMPGGFLRILNPEPSELLNLDTWREFYGMDVNGATADAEIEVDSVNLTMSIQIKGVLGKVKCFSAVDTDMLGNKTGMKRHPGPIENLEDMSIKVSIDPRK